MKGFIKVKPIAMVVIIMMTFSCMASYYIFAGNVKNVRWYIFYYGKFFISVVLTLMSFLTIIKQKENNLILKYIRKKMLKIFISPLVIILIYSSILWFINDTAFPYISRGISDILYTCLAYFEGICLVYMFGEDVLKYGIISVILTYIFAICIGIIEQGPGIIVAILTLNTSAYNMYLELHEAAFILGFYIIFLLWINGKKLLHGYKVYMFLILVFFFITGKRIGIAAVVLVSIYAMFVYRNRKYVKSKMLKITGFAGVIVSLFYVSLSTSSELNDIFNQYGISMMGRNILYNYFRQFCEFHINFPGQGVGFVSRQFDYTTSRELFNMASIKALHNDLMKMFIDIGFIGFIIWCSYWLEILISKFEKWLGTEVAYKCFLLIMYSFVTYTTDNTAWYFNFQVHFSMLITLIIYKKLKNDIIK